MFIAVHYRCPMEHFLTIVGIGVIGGALSGLLGIGGGIVTAPLLLYLPPALGQAPLSMHAVSGLTMTQAFFAGLLGTAAHGRDGTVDRKLVAVMAAAVFVASLAGAAGSKQLDHEVLLGIFAVVALAAALLLLSPRLPGDGAGYRIGSFSVPRAAGIASAVGLLGGLVGQGGSFLLIPAVVAGLRVPMRVAMSSNLPIVVFASAAGFLGKVLTGQVPTVLAIALIAGTAPASFLACRLSRRAPAGALRVGLGCLILLVCARMLWDLSR
ncbi:MAG: sulfite exporter TauE/SafE family protein [Deltaproteobacteria bacterium]|nr:sulfite exporter TauE/SafE family protein [Deltaproteobacteria bacterium]